MRVLLSGSVPEPLSVAVESGRNVLSRPAFAVGACGDLIIISTASVTVSVPSLTDSVNVMVAGPFGEVNVGCWVVLPVSVTAGPDVCAHEYPRESPSGSVPEPFRVIIFPDATI